MFEVGDRFRIDIHAIYLLGAKIRGDDPEWSTSTEGRVNVRIGHQLRIASQLAHDYTVFTHHRRQPPAVSFCTALAVRDMHMTIDEALAAATVGGAAALGRNDVGRIRPGSPGHAVILDAPSHHHLAYRPGMPLIAQTIGPLAGL